MNTLNDPICVGGKLPWKKSAWGQTDFLVKVDLTWVQDPRSFPQVFIKTSDQHIE